MPRRLLPIALLLAACGTAGELDARVVAALRPAVVATLAGMAVAAADQPSPRALDNQVALLALQVDRQRFAALESGEYGEPRLRDDAHQLDAWLARQRDEHHVDQRLPTMLAWLRDQPALSGDQRVLLHALIRQGQRETGFQPDDR